MTLQKTQTYHIKTFGCQANVADSNTISGVLEALGFEHTTDEFNCDVYIVNTCSIRQKSEDKVYGLAKQLNANEEQTGHRPFTVMSGCMVGSVTGDRQRYAFEELQTRTPWVNAYINPSQIMELPNILLKNQILSEWAVKKFDPNNVVAVQPNPKSAFVNISYGCDNFCTFCVVPYARGQEVSRSKEDIMREINHLVGRGFIEITLCGQNVNSWGLSMSEKFEIRAGSDQKLPFANLLREIAQIPSIEKISFLSSNPFDFTTDLIDALKMPKVSNYLHFAIQSGNNEVLKKMNRRHTVEEFMFLCEKIREARPDIEFGTDIIVGFPSETREQFMDSVSLVKNVKFNVAYISMYSPRKGTPAEKFFKDDVPLKEKRWRHDHLSQVFAEVKATL